MIWTVSFEETFIICLLVISVRTVSPWFPKRAMPRTSLQEGVPFDSRTVCSHRVDKSILAIPLAYEMTSVRLEINMAYTDLQSLGYRENSLTAPVIPTPSCVHVLQTRVIVRCHRYYIITFKTNAVCSHLLVHVYGSRYCPWISIGWGRKRKNESIFLVTFGKLKHLVKTCELVVLVDDIGHRGHYGRIDETEDENDAWPKVTENQTNHGVVTLS